jgi:hypothetical protein
MSKEGILPLSNFILESLGVISSGKVVIKGGCNDTGCLMWLTLEAFDRIFEVPQEKLLDLLTQSWNGVRIS